MGRRLLSLGAVAMLFAVVVATPASAAKPLYVEFDLTTYFNPDFTDTWEADLDSPAVVAGLMCKNGTKEELVPEKWSPPDRENKVTRNAQVISKYTCSAKGGFGPDDTFVIKAQLHFDVSVGGSEWVLNWVLKDGTGAFEGLRGNGSGDGSIFVDPEYGVGAADSFVGHLH